MIGTPAGAVRGTRRARDTLRESDPEVQRVIHDEVPLCDAPR
jgi:hypothetical protein